MVPLALVLVLDGPIVLLVCPGMRRWSASTSSTDGLELLASVGHRGAQVIFIVVIGRHRLLRTMHQSTPAAMRIFIDPCSLTDAWQYRGVRPCRLLLGMKI